jgi:outer membrane protein insertion porin family
MAAARFSASLAIALALSLASSTLSGQEVACDPGDVEVRRLNFEGNQHFDDDELATLINTTATNLPARSPALRWWLGHLFGRRRCLDRQDFPLDRLRLIVFYRNKGFDRATVDTLVQPVGRNAASVTFRIQEGAPIRIDTLLVRGLDAVPGARTHIDALRLRPGGLFDKYAIDTAQAELAARLRNDGYPRAQVVRSLRTDPARRAGTVELQVMPGPRARVGEVVVSVEPRDSSTPRRTSPRTVRSIFGVDSVAPM